jgi:hypothetical protein
MSRHNIFWGVILIVVGGLFLADNLGYVNFSFRLLWPLGLVALGAYILLSRGWESEVATEQDVTVPLDGAKEASVRLEYGAGTVRIAGTTQASELLAGKFSSMKLLTSKEGDKLIARLSTAVEQSIVGMLPWNWSGSGRQWDFALNPNIPISLKVESGAADTRIDLSETKTTKLKIETGASSNAITLPRAAGYTKVDISGGAASFDIRVPDGVAARIRVESGLGSISVDQTRFPRTGKHYESPDYETAANKVEIKIEVGVSSVTVK